MKTSDSNRSSASQAQRAAITPRSQEATPAGIEPAPPDRQSGVLTVILWSYVSCTGRRIPARLLFNMQTFSSANSYRDGIYHYDLVQSHIQHSCQYDQVANGRHCRTPEPFVDKPNTICMSLTERPAAILNLFMFCPVATVFIDGISIISHLPVPAVPARGVPAMLPCSDLFHDQCLLFLFSFLSSPPTGAGS